MYGGYIPMKKDMKKEVMEEVTIEEPSYGQIISDQAANSASSLIRGKFRDTVHPDGSRSSVCALAAGNIIKEAGFPIPDDGNGNQITNAANFFDQISGHPYAIKNYNTEFMANKEYENWKVIDNMEDLQPGDVILFKGSGYERMKAGNPTKTNPSGYHIGISTSEWSDSWGGMRNMTGGINLVDDRGPTLIWNRHKSEYGMEQHFLKAARYVGPND